jgi:tetratricopeptide (TPR) repeat protein
MARTAAFECGQPGLAPMKMFELTLAATLSVAASFHSGLELLKNKKYDEAAAQFSAVLEAKAELPALADYARYYRAEARLGANKKEEALKDLAAVLAADPDEALRKQAVARYQASGGDLAKLLPADSPKQTLFILRDAVRGRNPETIKSCFTGPLGELLAMMNKIMPESNTRPFMAIAEMLTSVSGQREQVILSETIDPTNQAASVSFSTDQGRNTLTVELKLHHGQWALASLQQFTGEYRARMMGQPVQPTNTTLTLNLQKLQQLRTAIDSYRAATSNAAPPKAEAIQKYLSNPDALYWQHAASGKKRAFLFYGGAQPAAATNSPDARTILVAAPAATDGKRETLRHDGQIELMAEEQFAQQAAVQQWTVPGLATTNDVPAALAGEIRSLITNLGSKEYKTRAAAKQRLGEIGALAFPFLEEQLNNPDPEIQQSVNDLMGIK